MASPILPSQITAIVPLPTDSLGQAMLDLMKFSLLFYQFYAWVYNSDGTLSDNFKRQYCDAIANCTP